MLEIKELKEIDHQEYRDFLKGSEKAHYGHSLEVMNLIETHFKFKPIYLIKKDKETQKIQGILPLFECNSFVEGKRLVSIPFLPLAGPVADSEETKKLLLQAASDTCDNKEAKFLEIRQRENITENPKWQSQSQIIDFMLTLQKDETKMMDSLHKSVRYDIRKALKNNLTVNLGNDTKLLNDFYNVYLNTRKRRGVPSWPKGFFSDALKTCNTKVAVCYKNKKPIAGCFLFYEEKHKLIDYGFAGTNYKYNHLCPYYALLWEIITKGIQKGYEVLDFGGSTKEMNDGGMFSFKKRWCDIQKPIHYHYYAKESKNIPSLEKSFDLYRIYAKVWSKIPKSIIKIISPPIIRQFH